MFSIMKIDLPRSGEYLIFESIKSAPAKVIHVFDLKNCLHESTNERREQANEFKVGRSVDTDMRIADISVSRIHSFISIVGNELILEDNGSKFGTLFKLSRSSEILSVINQQIDCPSSRKLKAAIYQVGRTMLYFKFNE